MKDTQRATIGFDRKIDLTWLDAAAGRLATGESVADVRAFLWSLLDGVVPGEDNAQRAWQNADGPDAHLADGTSAGPTAPRCRADLHTNRNHRRAACLTLDDESSIVSLFLRGRSLRRGSSWLYMARRAWRRLRDA